MKRRKHKLKKFLTRIVTVVVVFMLLRKPHEFLVGVAKLFCDDDEAKKDTHIPF